jgi:hypothetical protein
MSKKSEREARERKEQNEIERRLKFSTTLKGYLSTFGTLYRQDITEEAAGAYEVALQHLSPEALKIACDEAIKQCKFFPNPAEILQALKDFYDRTPMHATRAESEKEKFDEYFAKLQARGDAYRERMRKEELAIAGKREPGED